MPYTNDGWMSESEWYDREASRDAYERDRLDRERYTTADPMPEPAPLPPVTICIRDHTQDAWCYWCAYRHGTSETRTVRWYNTPVPMCAECREMLDLEPIDDDQEEAA